MASDFAKKLIKGHEGLRLKPYRCTAGRLTIGYGRNLDDRGITSYEADELFENDIIEAEVAIGDIFGIEIFRESEGRVAALTDMAFNLGEGGLRKFTRMIEAIRRREWEEAAKMAEESLWYKQVGNRAKTVVGLLRSG